MARCSVSSRSSCNWTKQAGNIVSTVTTHVYFQVIQDDTSQGGDSTYMASVTHLRKPGDEVSTGFRPYNTGEYNEVSESFIYTDLGNVEAGYSLTFGSGAGLGCEGKTFSETFVVKNDEAGCKLIKDSSPALPASSPNEDALIQSPPADVWEEIPSMDPIDSSVPHQNHICAISVDKAQDTCSFAPTCNAGDRPCPTGLFCFPDIVCDTPRMNRQNYCAYTPQELKDTCQIAPTCNGGEVCPAGMNCFPNVLCSLDQEEDTEPTTPSSIIPAPVVVGSGGGPLIQTNNPTAAPVHSLPGQTSPPSKAPIRTAEPLVSVIPSDILESSTTTLATESSQQSTDATLPSTTSTSASTPKSHTLRAPSTSPTVGQLQSSQSFTWYPSRSPSSAGAFSPTLFSGDSPSTNDYQQADSPDVISSAYIMYQNGLLILIICHYLLHM